MSRVYAAIHEPIMDERIKALRQPDYGWSSDKVEVLLHDLVEPIYDGVRAALEANTVTTETEP
jgi:hypothetical protein